MRLICPRQIGTETRLDGDGLNATYPHPILTINGKVATLRYDSTSNLPILYTAPGTKSFHKYLASKSTSHLNANTAISTATQSALSKQQCQKLYLHKRYNHEGFDNLNSRIHSGAYFLP